MSAFATLDDVILLSGRSFTSEEQERIAILLDLVSDALRVEAGRFNKDLDKQAASDPAYANTIRLVTTDVVVRVMRQSNEGDPMTQEAQSAMGYSWSGTYAIPGGGISNAIMRNDLKRLGLRRQQYGVIEYYGGDPDGQA